MSGYKATFHSKSDLYELLSTYEKRLHKKVEQIANKVLNLTNVDHVQREEPSRVSRHDIDNKARSHSLVQTSSFRLNDQSFTKSKIVSTIEDKLWEGGVHLPAIKDNTKSRTVGRNKYVRPRFASKKPTILPKEVRNNPFLDPRPVPVSDLKKGLINLMNKGVINRDVDISVAFEWGEAPLKSRGAMLHSHDEVVIHEEEEQNLPLMKQKPPSIVSSLQAISPEDRSGWALTDVDSAPTHVDRTPPKSHQQHCFSSLEVIHIEFKNYRPKTQGREFLEFKRRNLPMWGEIVSTMESIGGYLAQYSVTLAFVDANKLILTALGLTKPKDHQLLECLIGSSGQKKKHQSLSNILSREKKQHLAAQMISKVLKANMIRQRFKRSQHAKQCKQRIVVWIQSLHEKRKTRAMISESNIRRNERIGNIQSTFEREYNEIIQNKHFEIHLANRSGREEFLEFLNMEITRIFHLQKSLSIIYVCPFELSEETINYYYKILELGDVELFQDRVRFVSCQPSPHFQGLSLAKKLYYSPKTLKQIKQIVNISKAFIVPGEPEQADWYIVDSLKLPIFGNFRSYDLTSRGSVLTLLRVSDFPSSNFCQLDPSPSTEYFHNQMARKISNFGTDNKYKSVAMRINGRNNSVAIIKCPIRNFEDLLDRTIVYNEEEYSTTQVYLRALLRLGGTVQKQDTFRYLRSVVLISPSKEINILGTFQRILSSAFTLMGVCFPQQVVEHSALVHIINPLIQEVINTYNFYGYLEVDLVVDKGHPLIEHISWSLSEVGSSLFYFSYLAGSQQGSNGKYFSTITDLHTSTSTTQSRCYFYVPFALHYGMGQIQLRNFFQICRTESISFDLEQKYGSAFTLFEGVNKAVGILTTSKSLKAALGLMMKAVNFIFKQSIKSAVEPDRETRMRNKYNITTIKSRLEECFNKGMFE